MTMQCQRWDVVSDRGVNPDGKSDDPSGHPSHSSHGPPLFFTLIGLVPRLSLSAG